MSRVKSKKCAYYKPLSDLPVATASMEPSCSGCVFFSAKNCHKSSQDTLDYEYF